MLLRFAKTDELSIEDFVPTSLSWLNATRKKVSPKTTERRIISINSYLRFAGLGDSLDYKAPKPAKPVPHPLSGGMDDVRLMLKMSHRAHHRALIVLCGFMALRVNEAVTVEVKDFDLDSRRLRFRGKGDVERIVPIPEAAIQPLLVAICAARVRENGDQRVVPLGNGTARQYITRCGKKAGINRPVSSHDLRSTVATELLNRGVNIRVVQEVLGHASVVTTERYTAVTSRGMADAVNSL